MYCYEQLFTLCSKLHFSKYSEISLSTPAKRNLRKFFCIIPDRLSFQEKSRKFLVMSFLCLRKTSKGNVEQFKMDVRNNKNRPGTESSSGCPEAVFQLCLDMIRDATQLHWQPRKMLYIHYIVCCFHFFQISFIFQSIIASFFSVNLISAMLEKNLYICDSTWCTAPYLNSNEFLLAPFCDTLQGPMYRMCQHAKTWI